MREIKFRCFFYDGKNYSTGQMISLNEAIGENYIEWNENELKPTDECTILMQYIGLKDKNGKEIYEGDVLKYNYSRDTTGKDIVEFNEVVEWENTTDIIGFGVHQLMEHEIIGNIYENPTLIKQPN